MKISICTVAPETFEGFLQGKVLQRAVRNGTLSLELIDIRTFAGGSFRHLDDNTFGGGTGQVLRVDPVVKAIEAAKGDNTEAYVAALTPRGQVFSQKMARDLAELSHLVLVCGHYEGFDERIYHHVDGMISIGDFVLTGGELASQVITDAVVRLLPGVLKDEATQDESFETGLLEYPQYTQPADYHGDKVPEVLLSGRKIPAGPLGVRPEGMMKRQYQIERVLTKLQIRPAAMAAKSSLSLAQWRNSVVFTRDRSSS